MLLSHGSLPLLMARKIGIDMISGEHPEKVLDYTIPGVKRAIKKGLTNPLVLAGPAEILEKEFPRAKYHSVEILDCRMSHDNNGNIVDYNGEMVTAKDSKTITHPGASIPLLMAHLKEGSIDAIFTSGNTGILARNSRAIGRIEGVERAPLLGFFPTLQVKPSVMVDLGLNIKDVTPFMLYQYAVMGSSFYEAFFGKKNPTVRIVNIGEEETKGTDLTLAASSLLKSQPDIKYEGFIEAKGGVYLGKADVMVVPGELGNMLIKASEGTVKDMLVHTLKDEIGKKPKNWPLYILGILAIPAIGYAILVGTVKGIKQKISPDKYNGAILAGLNGVVVKGHSSSNRFAFAHGIENTAIYLNTGLNGRIEEKFSDADKMELLKRQYHYPYLENGARRLIVISDDLKAAGYSKRQVAEISEIIQRNIKK